MSKLLSVHIYPKDRDITKTWFIQYKIEGKPPLKKYGRLAKLFTVEERIKEAAKMVAEINKQFGEKAGKKEVDPILREIQEALKIHSIYLSKKSRATYESKVKEFVIWYRKNKNTTHVEQVGIGHAFVMHLKEKNLSHTTINAYRNTIKEFWPKRLPNPFLETFKLPESRSSYRYFDEGQQNELSRVISSSHPQLWLAIQLQYYLLLRPNELRTIKVGSFLLDERKVCVYGENSKNRKTQYIAIPDELIPSLEFLRSLPPYFYVLGSRRRPGLACHGKKHFPDLHQQILSKLNYNTQVYKFYSWKHTGAVMYYLKTGDIKSLMEQGRWHSMDMVNEYLKNLGVMDIERIRTDFPKIGGKGAAVIKIAN